MITANGTGFSFITVEEVDQEGNLYPNADNLIRFDISGNGKIAGVDNENPISMKSFKKPHRKAFHKKCPVMVQRAGLKMRSDLQRRARSYNRQESTLLYDECSPRRTQSSLVRVIY